MQHSFDDKQCPTLIARRTFSTHFEIFRRRVDGVVIYFFNSDFKFFDDASKFSVCFLYCLYFLLKVHVNFSSVFYRNYRAVGTSSRHRPFCFHDFVFLLNCSFLLYYAHRISVCVIAVSKSHEFLLKVRRLSSFFSTTTPTPSRRRVVIFSTTT